MKKLIERYQEKYVDGSDEAYDQLPEHDDEHIRDTYKRLMGKRKVRRLAKTAVATIAATGAVFGAVTAAHELTTTDQEQPKNITEHTIHAEGQLPFHIVKDKETIQSILGQIYGYENINKLIDEAKKINDIKDARTIVPGQKIYLPSPNSELVFDK